MKKRISPATAISLVALFFSVTGAGLSASRYLITSVSQIKPSVRAMLRSNIGPAGPSGYTRELRDLILNLRVSVDALTFREQLLQGQVDQLRASWRQQP